MNIGFDATSLYRKTTGIECYALNLLKSLLTYDKVNQYVVFCRTKIPPELSEFLGQAEFVISPGLSQIITEQLWFPYISSTKKLDLIHFPSFPPGILAKTKFVITIHDATMWRYANTLSWKNKLYMKPLTNIAIKKAGKIITVSESSKKDLVKYCNIDGSKVINTEESIGDSFKVIDDDAYLKKIIIKYNLPDKFILSVCSLEPRKNLLILLEAYGKLTRIIPDVAHKLVLVGRKAWGSNAITKKINELNLDSKVNIIGHIPINDLVGVYNVADLFVYPSIYEGFGLPPLEAMACGVPVIASDTSSMPEVLSDAAILINPCNPDQIAAKMGEVLTKDNLKKELIGKGLERVRRFSWEKAVEKTLRVYETIK